MPKVAQKDLEDFGRAAKRARSLKGWTLDQLSAALQKSTGKSFLSDIEKGKRPIGPVTVGKLIAALDLDQSWIDRFLESDLTPDAEQTPSDQIADHLMDMVAQDASAPATAESLLIGLAQEYADQAGNDLQSAYRALKLNLQEAAAIKARGEMPQNTADQVQEVMRRMAALNDQGLRAEAAEEVDAALAAVDAQRSALLDLAISQARILNNPASAAKHLVERLQLDTPADLFNSLRALQDEWYERGRDQGLAFDATVAIHLAEHTLSRAQTQDKRGAALNDLGIALSTLGEREAGTARLEQAVAAYDSALLEYTRDRVPLDWAMTQNNLGTALATLGEREAGTARLEQAVAAYESALLERTRDRVPLNWATTQNNLGNALLTLGEREAGTARLEQAVTAYEAALLERTRDRVPLDWAMTQNNLGNALQTLGEREAGSARLEQVINAYEQALLERTRDRVPLDWASTQFNLAAVEIVFFDKTADPAHLARARDYVMAAREVFVAAGADHYIGMADDQLAIIADREQT